MAGTHWVAPSAPETIGTGTETRVQVIAAANHRLTVTEWSISFKGIVATDLPIEVQLLRQSTGGTASGLTPLNSSSNGDTLDVTAQETFTAEPTPGDILDRVFIHPQAGYTYAVVRDVQIQVPPAGRLGVRTINSGGVDTTAITTIKGEE